MRIAIALLLTGLADALTISRPLPHSRALHRRARGSTAKLSMSASDYGGEGEFENDGIGASFGASSAAGGDEGAAMDFVQLGRVEDVGSPGGGLGDDLDDDDAECELAEEGQFASGRQLLGIRRMVDMLREQADEAARAGEGAHAAELRERADELAQRDAHAVWEAAVADQLRAAQRGDRAAHAAHAEAADAARARLPQFALTGLWAGRYGAHGHELIEVKYDEKHRLVARKLTGDENVPAHKVTFAVDLSPSCVSEVAREGAREQARRRGRAAAERFERDEMFREELARRAAEDAADDPEAAAPPAPASGAEAGYAAQPERPAPIEIDPQGKAIPRNLEVLERWHGHGQVACKGFSRAHFVPGQLVLIGDHFAFVWMTPGNAMGHQIFFTRPTMAMLREYVTAQRTRKMLARMLDNYTGEDENPDFDDGSDGLPWSEES